LRSGKIAWRPVAEIPDSSKPMRDFAQAAGWGGTLGVPLRLQERAIGALAVYTASGALPSETDLSLLTTIADQVAVVVENARLQEQARHLAAVQERQRLARELHDSVSQALYGIALGTRTARTLLDRDPSRAGEPLDYVLTLADAGLTEMRALIFELRPEALETEGLVAALQKQAGSLHARYGLAVEATFGPEPPVGLAVKEALYRIAQEALHNTVKHAHARHVEMRLWEGDDGVVLEVRDDGQGFDTGAAYPGHLGLHTMQERAQGVGARLQVESGPKQGTLIRVCVPRRG
jgi:signal transduction histidine kinase